MTTNSRKPHSKEPAESPHTLSLIRLTVGLCLFVDGLASLPAWGARPDAPGLLAGTTPLFSLTPGSTLALCHLQVALALLLVLGVATRGALLVLAAVSLLKALLAWPWLRFDYLLLAGLLPCLALNPGDDRLAADPRPPGHDLPNPARVIGWLVTVAVGLGVLARLFGGRADGDAAVVWLSWLPRLRPGLTEDGLLWAARTTAIVMMIADLLLGVSLRLRRLRVVFYVLLIPFYLALAGGSLMTRSGDWTLHALLMSGLLLAYQPPRFLTGFLDRHVSGSPAVVRLLQPDKATRAASLMGLAGLAVATALALPWILRWNGVALPLSLRAPVSTYAIVWLTLVVLGAGAALWSAGTRRGTSDKSPPRGLRAGLYGGALIAVIALAAMVLRLGGTAGRYTVHWTRHLLARGETITAGKLATGRSLRQTQPLAAARCRVLVTPILLRHGKIERASALLKFSGRHLPSTDPELASVRGALAMRKGDPVKAIRHYRRALTSELSPRLLLRLAAAHSVAKQIPKAIALLNRALILEPQNVDAHLALGISRYTEGHMDKAKVHFNRAIRLRPWSAQAYYFRGSVNQLKRDFTRARADYTRATRLSPNNPDIAFALARCIFQQGDRDEAGRVLSTYLLLHPKNKKIRAFLGSLPPSAPRRDP